MKIKLLISIILFTLFSLTAHADNYDIARKIQQDSKDVAEYQKSKMDGTYHDYSVTPTWVTVLYLVIGIAVVALIVSSFIAVNTIDENIEREKKDKEAAEIKQKTDINNVFLEWKRKTFSDFDLFIRDKFKAPVNADVKNLIINSEEIAEEFIGKIESMMGIEIYNKNILIGKKMDDIKNLLSLQLDRYDKWGQK